MDPLAIQAPTRHSTHVSKPTPALATSHEAAALEEVARTAGEEWAIDDAPYSYLASDAYTYLALLTTAEDKESDKYIPKHYGEAMRRPDLWAPPMDAELATLTD
ncbi:hypothetical protein C0991_002813 [Blastosporella zonata]|nr:hypothetical protein C0991_002813 [Blastosporella zonata]